LARGNSSQPLDSGGALFHSAFIWKVHFLISRARTTTDVKEDEKPRLFSGSRKVCFLAHLIISWLSRLLLLLAGYRLVVESRVVTAVTSTSDTNLCLCRVNTCSAVEQWIRMVIRYWCLFLHLVLKLPMVSSFFGSSLSLSRAKDV